MNFQKLVENRHSALNFEKDIVVTEQQFKKIISLTKLAPSAFNLQPAKYIVIDDPQLRNEVLVASRNQYKLSTASSIVVVAADKEALSVNAAETIYAPMLSLGMIDDLQYNQMLKDVTEFLRPLKRDPALMEIELTRSTMVSATFFLLAAESLGLNTCPVHIGDKENLKKVLGMPNNLIPLLLLPVGKSVAKKRERGYRRPSSEMLYFNKFN